MEETDETGTVEKASGNVQLSTSLPSAPLLHQHVAFPSLARCPGGGQLGREAAGPSGIVLLWDRIGEQPSADRLWGAVPSLLLARRRLWQRKKCWQVASGDASVQLEINLGCCSYRYVDFKAKMSFYLLLASITLLLNFDNLFN